MNLQNTLDNLFPHTLFQIFKKHTSKSEKIWDNFFLHTLFQMFKKEYLRI